MIPDATPIPTRLRPDLQWSPYAIDRPDLWIAHDPVYREFYFFNEVEKAIALHLDGNHSVNAIVQQMRRIDETVTASFVMNLVRRLDQASLLLNQNWRTWKATRGSESRRWLTNANSMLARRVPLIDPSKVIEALAPIGRILGCRWSLWALLAMVVGCVLMLGMRWSELIAGVIALQSGLRGDRLLLAAILLLVIKAMHEFGHALACRTVGADCREMGVFFFFGAPCMYCDVSDTWRVPNRWKRVFVSAAGMITELLIAVVACVVWYTNSLPWVQSIALQVMLCCTVVTVLINANPLLRYDGYYILSDALGIPNLAEQSREAWSQIWRSLLFGDGRSDSVFRQTALACFHIASSCYRWFLLAVLLWSSNQWLFHRRLGGFGTMLTVVIATAVIANLGLGVKSSVYARRRTEPIRWFRLGFWVFAFATLVWIGGTWRFTHYLFARGVVESAEQVTLYARHSAMVSGALKDGASVTNGSTVVSLESPELELKRIQSEGDWNEAKVRLQQAANRSVDDPVASRQLAELEKSVISIEERVEKLVQETNELKIQSKVQGEFRDRSLERSQSDLSGRRFGQRMSLGTLAQDRPFVERGESLGEIILSNRLRLSTFVSELEIDQCKVGANVNVRLDQMPGVTVRGRVVSISAESLQRTPTMLIGDVLFASTLAGKKVDSRPEQTTYSVVIEFDMPNRRPIAKGLASVQIETASKTLLEGWFENLQQLWRFKANGRMSHTSTLQGHSRQE